MYMQSLYTFLAKWNKTTDSLAKVQGTYAVLAVSLLLIAGLVSLMHRNLGQSILFLAIVAGLAFVANGVIWAIVRTFVVPHIEEKKPTPTRKK